MAIIDNPRSIELNDIQGLVTRGYGKLLGRAYLLLTVEDAAKAKQWIETAIQLVDDADHTETDHEMYHLAFTAKGLRALGLSQTNLDNFPIPFREGMDTPNRNRILGDHGRNKPDGWRWGGESHEAHILVILHAKDAAALQPFLARTKEGLAAGGLRMYQELPGFKREDGKEPFGFHDGISQPTIKGSGRPGPDNDIIETGEFLFGYKNAYGYFPYSPLISEDQGDMNMLPPDAGGSGKKDLGRNGSMMVFRQIQQHVDDFWSFMEEKTMNPDGSVNEKAKIRLASKCVGRWPSGASLVNFPDEDPGGLPENDDFGYADTDAEGLKCPYGSHMRRNNPRDHFRFYGKEQSLKISARHRIIRRGSSYKMAGESGQEEIGLHFVCFNTNIEMQFEFIQHAWANNRQLHNLTNDIDVIIGVPAQAAPDKEKSQFTIQAEPVNEYIDDVKPFVTIRGGEYFFFPGIAALHYLTTL